MGGMRMYVLDLGTMQMDKSLLIRNWRLASRSNPNPPAELIEIPVSAYLIDHPDGRVLYDTGCHPASMGPEGRWPAEFQDHFPYLGGEECQLPNRLQQLGIGPDDIRYVVLSHMHSDHAGCVEFFRKSTLIVHRDELSAALRQYAAGERASAYAWADADHWIRLGLHWRTIARDESPIALNDRITIHNWGSGHTYGMLGLQVDLKEQAGIVLTSDAVYCGENYFPPQQPQGVVYDSLGYERTIAQIRDLAERTQYQVWFGHDPVQFPRLRKSTEGWYE